MPRVLAGLLATAIVAASILLGPAAHGAEVSVAFSASLPLRATDWTDVVVLPRFDPALGELRAVDLTIDAHLEGTMAIENLAAASATLQARLAAVVDVRRPGPGGDSIATIQPAASRIDDLDAFDGTLDHAGASGRTHDLQANLVTTATLTHGTDLVLFTGLTPITLRTSGSDTSTGPSGPDVDTQLSTQVGTTVTVTYTYVSDTRPPDAPTILTSPSAYTSDPDPVVTFTAEAGASTECRLETPTSPGAWAPCTSPWQANLGPGGDGMYTFSVRATDGAGNVGEPADSSFTLDQASPDQPVLTHVPPPRGQSPHPTWAFTIQSGAVARCTLDGSAPLPCSSPFTADLVSAPGGDHIFGVFAVDAAGNAGPPTFHTYLLDREPPAPPTITVPAPSPGNDPTPTWAFELAPDATTASCSVDGAPFTACTSPFTVNLATADDGPHTLAVRNADAADNQSLPSTSTYELDRSAPGAPTIVSPASPSNVVNPVWGITAEDGATTQCRLDDGAWVACDGSFTTTFGPGNDGVHALAVVATDASGNEGPEAIAVYSLDTTAPDAPVIATSPADPSNSPTAIWTFTAEAGSQASCSLDGGLWAPCSSPHSVDLATADDGVHRLAVRATDAQGNTGPPAESSFTLDRAAPAAPSITSAPPSPGSEATVRWSFTTPDGTTTSCRIDMGPVLRCSDHVDVTFSDDGNHRLRVVARDEAGNQSAAAMAMYTLDRVAPVAPTITGRPPSPTRLATPQWTFAVEDGSTGECSVDGTDWVPCATSYSVDLSSADDGVHTFAVRSVDAADNVGEAATHALELDRTPPGAARITGGPDAHSRDDTPTWAFAIDDGAVAECRIDDGPWVPCDGALTADLTSAPDGTHALEVRVFDSVGNEGPTVVSAYGLDRVAAVAAVFTSTPLSPGNDAGPAWTFTYEPGTTAWCSIDGSPAIACDGAYAAELTEDGSHELLVVISDAAGNTSEPATNSYELDTIAPDPPRVTAPRTPDRDERPEWEIDLEPGPVAECSFDGGAAMACGEVFTADMAGREGSHRLVVVARDAAGNGSDPVLSTYVLDTASPEAPVLHHTPDRTAWSWRFSLETGATAECSIDGGPWTVCTSPMAAGTPDETVRFEVRAVDRAGNRSAITGTTVTPTLGPGTPPPVTPPTPGLGPAPAASPGTGAGPAMLVAERPGQSLRPSADVLTPEARGGTEVEFGTVTSGFRQPDGPFSGPVRDLLQAAAESTTIPVLVILVVLGFVAVQNRIDRRDPKLADAPIRHEPEYLEFE